MKKTTIYIVAAIALAACLGVAAYFFTRPKADLSSALPRDAVALGRVDCMQLTEGNNMLRRVLARFVPSEAIQQTGIDIAQPAYVFAARGYYGMLVPLRSERDFLQQLHLDDDELRPERGMKWSEVGNFLLCSDGDKAMLLGPVAPTEMEALRPTIYEWMRQTTAPSDNELFQALEGREALLSLAAKASFLPAQYAQLLQGVLPTDAKVERSMLLATVHQDAGALTLEAELRAGDKRLDKYLDALDDALLPTTHTEDIALEGALLNLSLGLDGEKLLPLLRQNEELRTKLLGANMIADVDLAIKSIRGDVAFALTNGGEHILRATLSDDGFMQNVSQWNEGLSKSADVQFIPAKNDGYIFAYDRHVYYFGARDKRFYIANAERLTHLSPASQEPSAAGDYKAVVQLDLSEQLGSLALLLPFEPRLELRMRDVRHCSVVLR